MKSPAASVSGGIPPPDAIRVVETFVSNMSHELRTPMAVVLGSLELLDETTTTLEQAELIATARGAGGDLLDALERILDFCRLEAGQLGVVRRAFDLKSVLADVVARHEERAKHFGLELSRRLGSDMPQEVYGDARRLAQVIDVLLDNAVKFTEQGWVNLHAEVDGTAVDDGLLLRITVTDSGIGIAHAELDSLFSPFRQVGTTRGRRFGGTGIGLALAKRLVELMGGCIEVSSVAGCGSTFSFTTRLGLVSKGATPRCMVPFRPRHSPPRVLVVDDDRYSREFVVRALAPLGVDPQAVESGRDAIRAVSEVRPDLIVMDLQMPEVDGLAASVRIHELDGLSDVPIVGFTADAAYHESDRWSEAGISDCLAKPTSVRVLQTLVRRWLGLEGGGVSGADQPLDRRRSPVTPVSSNASGIPAVSGERTQPQRRVGVSGAEHPPSRESSAGVLDFGRIQELSDPLGDSDIARELSEIFVDDMISRLEELEVARAAGDVEELRRLGHAVKGASGNFGAVAMASIAERIERDAEPGAHIGELKAAFDDVRIVLGRTLLAPSSLGGPTRASGE